MGLQFVQVRINFLIVQFHVIHPEIYLIKLIFDICILFKENLHVTKFRCELVLLHIKLFIFFS